MILCRGNKIIWVRIETKPVKTLIIEVYMPASTYEDGEVERVYEEIEKVLKGVKRTDNLILMGDSNVILGEEKEESIVGKYGLGKQNERGERLVKFCMKHKLVIVNTLFKNHKRWIYRRAIPGDIGRYQIEYILVKKRFRNQVKDCKSYPGADIDNDYNIDITKCSLKFNTTNKVTRIDGPILNTVF